MKPRFLPLVLLGFLVLGPIHGDTFGGGELSIEFVEIGNAGNAADDTGYGAVDYDYRISKHEVSEYMIHIYKQNSTPLIFCDNRSFDHPATSVSWNEAARFVNWLNVDRGYVPAYKFTTDGQQDNIVPWADGDAGYDPDNPFRNANAHYFLPSEDEWYKAAYYDPGANAGTGGYWNYATGGDDVPDGIDFHGDTVFDVMFNDGHTNTWPNTITAAGVLSPYGTMGQNGNVRELLESAWTPPNDSGSEARVIRGGSWNFSADMLIASFRSGLIPDYESDNLGFRVASAAGLPQVVLRLTNVTKSGDYVRADIASNIGDVTVYRTVDMISFEPAPPGFDIPPGANRIIDPDAPPGKAFYVIVPAGSPPP